MAQTTIQGSFLDSTLDITGLVLSGASPLVFEGASADAHETTLAFVDPTADRTITFPNTTGTLALTSDLTSYLTVANPTFTGTLTVGSATVTEAQLEILDGASVTTAELNLLDGVSGLVQADLTKLAAIDSTSTELNLLDALDRGSILYGNASGVTTVLGQGGADTVLTSDGDDISWQAAGGGVVSGGTDNAILRADGTGGSTSQGSPVTIANTTGTITLPAAGSFIAGTGDCDCPGFTFVGDLNTGMFKAACHEIGWTTNGGERMRLDGTELRLGHDLGTANGKMAAGLSICQDEADDQIFALKSSDVAHGVTNASETDTFYHIQKIAAATGGAEIYAFNAGGSYGIRYQAIITCAADVAKSTSASGAFDVFARRANGITTQTIGSNGNIAAFRDDGVTRFILDAEGSGHADVEWTTYSDNRLKFNQEVVPYGLDTLLQLQPKIYCRESGYLESGVPVLEGTPFRHIGFVAQEVKALIPEIVKDVCSCTSWYSLEDGKLTAVVVKAIQELSVRVDALEGK